MIFGPILNLELFIESLKTSELIAQCPRCDKEFKLSNSLLFDGTKSFPDEAEKKNFSSFRSLLGVKRNWKKERLKQTLRLKKGLLR